MNHTAETLPDNTALLKEIILKQAQRIASLEEFIRLEKQQRYGASSEKSADQGELFNEAEAIVEECAAQEDVETEANDNAVSPKRKPVRKPLPAELPRIRRVYELSLEERHCSCGCTLTEIGEEIGEEPAPRSALGTAGGNPGTAAHHPACAQDLRLQRV